MVDNRGIGGGRCVGRGMVDSMVGNWVDSMVGKWVGNGTMVSKSMVRNMTAV